jgi:hypothetical protein
MNITPFRKSILAVQWDRENLDYLLAERHSGSVKVRSIGTARLVSDEGEPLAVSDVLKQEVQRLGVRKPKVVVGLNRAQVDVSTLELPPATDDELPELVMNQVLRDAGDLADEGVVDFVPLSGTGEEARRVFAFIVERGALEHVEQVCAEASAKPVAVVYRPLACVTLLQRVVPQSQQTMILATVQGNQADLSIVRHGQLIYTRTARLGSTETVEAAADKLAVEVQRSLAAASLTPDAEDQHMYVFGALDSGEPLVELLADKLSVPVSLLDPLRHDHIEGLVRESASRVAPLLGMVHEHFADGHPIDFLHPKQPPSPPNPWRRVGGYAAVAAALLLCFGYWQWNERAKANEELGELRDSLRTLTKQVEKVQQKQRVVTAVQAWQRDGVNWLDELYDITNRFPKGSDALVRKLNVSPGRGGTSVIDMAVQVRDPTVVTEMGDEIRDSFHDVRSKRVSERSSSKDYPWQFETQITLRPRTVKQYRGEVEQTDSQVAAADQAADR